METLQQSRNVEEALGDEFFLYNLSFEADVGSAAALETSHALWEREVVNVRDITPLIGVSSVLDDLTEFSSQIHEVRLTSAESIFADRVDWILGAFYRSDEETFRQDIQADGLGDIFDSLVNIEREQRALFGELDIAVTAKLVATVGVRWYDYSQDVAQTDAGLVAGAAPGEIIESNGSASESGISPKFRLAYDASDNMLVYLVAARGFREGGPTGQGVPADPVTGAAAPTQFDADALWNYEVGIKNNWFADRLIFNGAAFYLNWKDIQTGFVRSDGFTFTVNAGGARSVGMEVELKALPMRGLGAVFHSVLGFQQAH